jgi:ADP-heptose:LPS heptosyltransferase
MGIEPKNTVKKIWVRMPNWLGDFVMAFPHLRAIKAHRPEAQLTLIAKPQFKDLIELFSIADEFVPLQKGAIRSFRELSALGRDEKPECHVLFTNSVRGDLEAWFGGADRRVGMAYPGRYRPLLTGVYRLDAFQYELDVTHQTSLLEDFLKSFDLIDSVEANPFDLEGVERIENRVGLIAGSSNNAQKCWAVENWCRMINALSRKLPDAEFVLFGTETDREISAAVVNGCSTTVRDRTGMTNMSELAKELAACSLVVGNDTGGMHLANAVGAPVAVLFGPTNPLVTGPFFDASKLCLQPDGCPPEGEHSIELLKPEKVTERLGDFLETEIKTGGRTNVD